MKPFPDFDTTSLCFHCGLPVPANTNWMVSINQQQHKMCCPGCQAVAEAIVAAGCSDYYSSRNDYSVTASTRDDLVPAQLQAYDLAADETAGTSCESIFSIEGIRCAACVWLIEHRLSAIPGIQSVNMNVSGEKLQVKWDGAVCQPSLILQALHQIGYTAYPYNLLKHGEIIRQNSKQLFRQLFIAGLSMMQVMMYAFPFYLISSGSIEAEHAQLLRWASLFLTLPAVCYSALPFYKGACLSLRNRNLGMDVSVTIGILTAFFASVVATWSNQGDVYFDSVTMFVFLLLCSRYLELAARRKAFESLERLQHALPATASRLLNYPHDESSEMVAASQLRAEDFILVRPGEIIAADSIVIEGETSIDASLLSGESRPVVKKLGDELPGGAVNTRQAVLARVLRSAEDSRLSILLKLTERAGMSKPSLILWADRFAAWFVAALLLLAMLFFLLWHYIDPAKAWSVAIAILVVSCPCALSLATPTALASAADNLLRRGILIMRPNVLETLARTTHVVFDKTGTLTLGKPVIQDIHTYSTLTDKQCLRLAAELEVSSNHPVAIALKQAALQEGVVEGANGSAIPASQINSKPGQGLQAIIDGVTYRIGNRKFIEETLGYVRGGRPPRAATSVYLASESAYLARFDLQDAPRRDAAAVIRQLQAAGKEVILLSGDDQEITQDIADKLGIGKAYGSRLPEQKLQFVQALQQAGAVVTMVGDGINDAAVLRAADVSFAMGNGAAMAQVNADAVLLSENLDSLLYACSLARETGAVIRQNLLWAGFYNLIAIPAAACGYVGPLLSGAGMAVSSMVVVVNALKLRRISRKSFIPGESGVGTSTPLPAIADWEL